MPDTPINTTANLSMDSVYDVGNEILSSRESDLVAAQNAAKGGASTAETMKLEYALQKWSLATSLNSNMIKAVSDAIRSIIKNVN